MKNLFKNFVTTLRRYRLSSTLNILGLGTAFAAFIVIMMQVHYDYTVDTFHPKSGRIFRVERLIDGRYSGGGAHRPEIDDILRDIPEIEYGSLLAPGHYAYSKYGPYVSVERNGVVEGHKVRADLVFPDFLDIFDFEMVEGSREAFSQPNSIVIPQSLAGRMFGDESPLHQPVRFSNPGETLIVAGVYRDFPKNTQVQNAVYVRQDPQTMREDDSWYSGNYYFYVALASADQKEQVERRLEEYYAREDIKNAMPPHLRTGLEGARLLPLEDIYFQSGDTWSGGINGNKTTTRLLLAIAILVIVIAVINFVNFATSLTPMRIKSINTRKVLGSSTASLRGALVGEAIGISLVAFGVALIVVGTLGSSGFQQLLTTSLAFSDNLPVLGLALVIALVTGLVAGLYPAWYTTSFPPALVLKGSFGLSPTGKRLRTALVGFQFVVSTALIVAALFMQVQTQFMYKMDTGVDTDRLMVLELNEELTTTHRNTLINDLKANPQIEQVAFSTGIFGAQDGMMTRGMNSTGNDNPEDDYEFNFHSVTGSWDLPQLLGVKLTEGSFFTEGDQANTTVKILLNESARRKYNIPVGWRPKFGDTELAGYIEDFNYRPLRAGVEPMGFLLEPENYKDQKTAYIRYSGDAKAALAHIRSVVGALDPAHPIVLRFYEDLYREAYLAEHKSTWLITIFSMLAIVISLIGVFGLVMFETQYRRKEISLRKVMGATVAEILAMFNRRFVKIVTVCFILALPPAIYGIKQWLSTFAYKTPMHWWVFALSLVIVMLITMTTVTLQSLRAATANPVDALKSE